MRLTSLALLIVVLFGLIGCAAERPSQVNNLETQAQRIAAGETQQAWADVGGEHLKSRGGQPFKVDFERGWKRGYYHAVLGKAASSDDAEQAVAALGIALPNHAGRRETWLDGYRAGLSVAVSAPGGTRNPTLAKSEPVDGEAVEQSVGKDFDSELEKDAATQPQVAQTDDSTTESISAEHAEAVIQAVLGTPSVASGSDSQQDAVQPKARLVVTEAEPTDTRLAWGDTEKVSIDVAQTSPDSTILDMQLQANSGAEHQLKLVAVRDNTQLNEESNQNLPDDSTLQWITATDGASTLRVRDEQPSVESESGANAAQVSGKPAEASQVPAVAPQLSTATPKPHNWSEEDFFASVGELLSQALGTSGSEVSSGGSTTVAEKSVAPPAAEPIPGPVPTQRARIAAELPEEDVLRLLRSLE